MPEPGEQRRAHEVGKRGATGGPWYVWVRCPDCGRERWRQKQYLTAPWLARCADCGHARRVATRREKYHQIRPADGPGEQYRTRLEADGTWTGVEIPDTLLCALGWTCSLSGGTPVVLRQEGERIVIERDDETKGEQS